MKRLVSFQIMLLVTISFLVGCSASTDTKGLTGESGVVEQSVTAGANSSTALKKVKVDIIKSNVLGETLSYIGTIKSSRTISVRAKQDGTVENIYIKEGTKVKKDDVLIDLRNPVGESTQQIGLELANLNLNSARQGLEDVKKSITEKINASELAQNVSAQRLKDTEETLQKTTQQNLVVVSNVEIQLGMANRTLDNLKSTIDLTKQNLVVSNDTVVNTTNVTLENAYNSLELALYATFPSIFATLNASDLPSGLNSLENDLEDLQDDLDHVRRNDPKDMKDIVENFHDYVLDFSDYLHQADVLAAAPTVIPTVQSTVSSMAAQMDGISFGLVNANNTIESLRLGQELQLKALVDQIANLEDQMKMQRNAVENTKMQGDLSTHALRSSINLLNKDVEGSKISFNLTKISTSSELRGAEDRLKQAELSVKQSKMLANFLEVKAPLDGVVSKIYIKKGDYVAPGAMVFDIFEDTNKEIEILVDPKNISKFVIGNPVEIKINSGDNKNVTGKVGNIFPTADQSTHLIQVIILVDDGSNIELMPNVIAEVFVPVDLSQDIYIPLKSVLVRNDGNYVYILENGKTTKKIVKLGDLYGSNVHITEGLKLGDILITEGQRTLVDGEFVEIITD